VDGVGGGGERGEHVNHLLVEGDGHHQGLEAALGDEGVDAGEDQVKGEHVHGLHQRLHPLRPQCLSLPLPVFPPLALSLSLLQPPAEAQTEADHAEEDRPIPRLQTPALPPELVFEGLEEPLEASLADEGAHPLVQAPLGPQGQGVRGRGGREGGREGGHGRARLPRPRPPARPPGPAPLAPDLRERGEGVLEGVGDQARGPPVQSRHEQPPPEAGVAAPRLLQDCCPGDAFVLQQERQPVHALLLPLPARARPPPPSFPISGSRPSRRGHLSRLPAPQEVEDNLHEKEVPGLVLLGLNALAEEADHVQHALLLQHQQQLLPTALPAPVRLCHVLDAQEIPKQGQDQLDEQRVLLGPRLPPAPAQGALQGGDQDGRQPRVRERLLHLQQVRVLGARSHASLPAVEGAGNVGGGRGVEAGVATGGRGHGEGEEDKDLGHGHDQLQVVRTVEHEGQELRFHHPPGSELQIAITGGGEVG
jgi:hypothetical protein